MQLHNIFVQHFYSCVLLFFSPPPCLHHLDYRQCFLVTVCTVHNATGIQSLKHNKETNTISRLSGRGFFFMNISIFFLKYCSVPDFVMAHSILCSKLLSNLNNKKPQIPEWEGFTMSWLYCNLLFISALTFTYTKYGRKHSCS